MTNKIEFIIPDFLNEGECTYFLSTFSSYKDIFKDNIEIIGLIGEFPGCCFGTVDNKFNRYKIDEEYLVYLKKKYNNELNTSLYIRMQNNDLLEQDLNDEYSNLILKIFDDKKNYVICKSEMLANYIKINYKRINVILEYQTLPYQHYENILINSKIFENTISKLLNKNIIIELDKKCIPDKKTLFKHKNNESSLFKINVRKNKYYNNYGIDFINKNEQCLIKEELAKYYGSGINKFVLPGSGVYNHAMIENIMDHLYKDEYKVDARKNIYPLLIALKVKEEIEIHNYRL